jgi:hypothetical protein
VLPPVRFLGLSAICFCVFDISCRNSAGFATSAVAPAASAVVERCPNEPYQKPDGSWGHSTEDSVVVPLAGQIQGIPEYHDCQRLLNRELQYGPLVGVWSRDRLASVPVSRYSQDQGVAVAELYNFSPQGYFPLGLPGSGYSCLYMKREISNRRITAMMVYLGSRADCPERFDPREFRVTTLQVKVQPNSRGAAPAAARWDMDPKSRIQYIGIWCPDGWCEVGVPGFASSAEYSGAREERVKGWYDEQYLSVYDSVSKKIRPSSIRGRTIPAAGLDTMTLAHFACNPCGESHWRQTATVVIEKDSANFYGRKLNLEAGVRSNISVRHNLRRGTWEALIVRTGGSNAKVTRQVIRVDHSNIRVPGTSRWHFIENDETVWMRCSNGCCDVRDF